MLYKLDQIGGEVSSNLREKIERGLYDLIVSLLLLLIILIITSRPGADLILTIRFLAIVIFVLLMYKFYQWLKKEE